MNEVKEIVQERDLLIQENEKIKSVSRLLAQRARKVSAIQEQKKGTIINKATKKAILKKLFGGIFQRGIFRTEKNAYQYYQGLTQKIKENYPNILSKTLISTGEISIKTTLDLYINKIAARLSRRGTLDTAINRKEVDWKNVEQEIEESRKDLENVIALIERIIHPSEELKNTTYFFTQKGISLPQAVAFSQKISKTNVRYFFNYAEVTDFFAFCENAYVIFKKEKISIVYAIDRSGRLLGFLFHRLLQELGESKGIKTYFIHGNMGGTVSLYAEKQKKELQGKKVLLIDEYVATGRTMKNTINYLGNFTGNKEFIFPCAFSSITRGYNAVQNYEPSWFFKKEYSGMDEKKAGGVQPQQKFLPTARMVRKSLSKLAPIIAEYLQLRGVV